MGCTGLGFLGAGTGLFAAKLAIERKNEFRPQSQLGEERANSPACAAFGEWRAHFALPSCGTTMSHGILRINKFPVGKRGLARYHRLDGGVFDLCARVGSARRIARLMGRVGRLMFDQQFFK